MPIYEYRCRSCSRVTEDFTHLAKDAPNEVYCSMCDGMAQRIPSQPTVMQSSFVPGIGRIYNPDTPVSGAHNIFEGIKGLEGHDGKNRVKYKSKKIQVDLGKREPRCRD